MPLSDNTRRGIAFGAPAPGQSLTDVPKNAAWEQPSQFTKLEDVMHYMMDQLTEPQHLKQLLQMMRAGMAIEAIARTLVFTGFASGKWGVDLGMLMYKPLMLSLIAIAHRAGITDVPVVMPKAVQDNKNKQLENFITSEAFGTSTKVNQEQITPLPTNQSAGMGFMLKPQDNV